MRKLANSLLRKEVITLDRIGKNSHFSALEIDQRDRTIWKVFMLEKQPNFGKEWESVAFLPGLLSFPCLSGVKFLPDWSRPWGPTVRLHACVQEQGDVPVESKNQGRFVSVLNFYCVLHISRWQALGAQVFEYNLFSITGWTLKLCRHRMIPRKWSSKIKTKEWAEIATAACNNVVGEAAIQI